MNDTCNRKPSLLHFIKGSFLKKKYYYCGYNKCRCIESEATKKNFHLLGRITVGLYAGFMGYYLRDWVGVSKWIILVITSLFMVLIEDIVHWKFAKFIQVINEGEKNKFER